MKKIILILLMLAGSLRATDNCSNLPTAATLSSNGLLRTPPMGWSSWMSQGNGVTEAAAKAQAALLISTGLADAGYKEVWIEDAASTRDGSGNIQYTNFPDGLAATVAYIHGLGHGLKVRGYLSPYLTTCGGYVGSGLNEAHDAAWIVAQGVDGLRYDGCNVGSLYASCYTSSGPQVWQMFAQFLRSAGGANLELMTGATPSPWTSDWTWAKNVGYNEYRFFNTDDINGVWSKFDGEIDIAAGLAAYQTPGFWADPDFQDPGFTATQKQTMFGMSALWGAAIILGADLSTISSPDLTLYKNADVIAVDQDSAGVLATRTSSTACGSKTCEVWTKAMHDGSYAVGLLNRDASSHTISVSFSGLGSIGGVRNLWAQSELGGISSYSATVAGDGLVLLKVTPSSGTEMQNVTIQDGTLQ